MPVIKNQEILERNARRIYGCSLADAVALNDGLPLRQRRSAANLYVYQRQAASKRCIGWEISFPEWVEVWRDSGKWCLRGVGIGSYCMSRHGDTGPYKVGNVSIKTIVENSREGIERGRPAMQANAAHRRSRGAGHGKGWAYLEGRKSPYQVYLGKKYVGCFATQVEAEAAFRAAVVGLHGSLSIR